MFNSSTKNLRNILRVNNTLKNCLSYILKYKIIKSKREKNKFIKGRKKEYIQDRLIMKKGKNYQGFKLKLENQIFNCK